MKNLLIAGSIGVALSACVSLDPAEMTRPSGQSAYQGNRAELISYGAELWKDPKVGNSGLACQSCHINGAQFKSTFKQPYPHKVAMASGKASLDEITSEQMVQLCMKVPMKAEALPWDSRELAALSAYIDDVVQPEFAAK